MKEAVQKLAMSVHRHLGLRHYSAIDVIIHPKRGIYLLEVDTHPSMAENSLFQKTLKTSDIPMEEFIDHVLTLALENQKK